MEFNIIENNIVKMGEYIIKISFFVELVCQSKPKYVVFNKKNTDFEIIPNLYQFSHKQIIDAIFESGTEKYSSYLIVQKTKHTNKE